MLIAIGTRKEFDDIVPRMYKSNVIDNAIILLLFNLIRI